MTQETPIPQPPPRWLLGNLPDIDPSQLVASTRRLFKLYGPIFKLDMHGRTVIHVGSHELIDELSDDERFEKYVSGALWQVRNLVGTGLFTTNSNEHVSSMYTLKSVQS